MYSIHTVTNLQLQLLCRYTHACRRDSEITYTLNHNRH